MTGQCVRVTDGVLLTGSVLRVALYAVEVARRSRARNALPPLRALEDLRQAMSPAGQTDIAPDAVGHSDDVGGGMTTEEAASLLHCSVRQARRLAPGLGGRLAGGRWFIDRQALSEHLEGLSK